MNINVHMFMFIVHDSIQNGLMLLLFLVECTIFTPPLLSYFGWNVRLLHPRSKKALAGTFSTLTRMMSTTSPTWAWACWSRLLPSLPPDAIFRIFKNWKLYNLKIIQHHRQSMITTVVFTSNIVNFSFKIILNLNITFIPPISFSQAKYVCLRSITKYFNSTPTLFYLIVSHYIHNNFIQQNKQTLLILSSPPRFVKNF